MKREYISPEIEKISLSVRDVLAASTYSAVPEVPTRAGSDEPIVDGDL